MHTPGHSQAPCTSVGGQEGRGDQASINRGDLIINRAVPPAPHIGPARRTFDAHPRGAPHATRRAFCAAAPGKAALVIGTHSPGRPPGRVSAQMATNAYGGH